MFFTIIKVKKIILIWMYEIFTENLLFNLDSCKFSRIRVKIFRAEKDKLK